MAVVRVSTGRTSKERSDTQRKRSVRGRHYSRTEDDGTCRFSRLARKSEGHSGVSQTYQFDRDSAAQLMRILQQAFPELV
jgi:hypothetical protein